MTLRLGQRARCQRCGGKIVLISDPRVISLSAAVWIHVGAIRRLFGMHPAEGPTS
jgi:hypothetical protein